MAVGSARLMTVIAMSRREIDRMHVLRDLVAGRITASEAAQLMRLTRRHVFRLAKAYWERGPAALVSTRRGKPSNRRYPAALWTEVLALIKANYPDFGPTLAREKLVERHGIHLGVETLRQWMLADGLWRDRKQRLKPVHQPRYRRDCVGELVQIDGSEHGWFEDRGPPCTLLVFIDDAAGGDGMTQFGRALDQLNIDIICANAPQAKGRVERANGTLQDRLVKEMRLAGISTIEAGNAFLPAFMEDYNRRFAKEPRSDK